jgi:hypothetical protein
MPRLQKKIALVLVLFLAMLTCLCLIDFGGSESKINMFAVKLGLKSVSWAPTFESGRSGLSIVSVQRVQPNVSFLLIYAILGFVVASTVYGLQPKIGGLGSADWIDVGRRMADSGYYDEAADAYSVATQLNPKAAKAYAERGVVYHKAGDFERAVQDYHTALRMQPVLTEYYQELGDYFDSLKKVAHHEVTDIAYGTPVEEPRMDFLWCPNCFVAMKVAKGSRGVFNCPKCKYEFFA